MNIREAREQGLAVRRLEIVVEPGGLKHRQLVSMLDLAGIEWIAVGGHMVCRPCLGRGVVDDGTAEGCLRSTMPCPTCDGQGRFERDVPR